MKTVGVSSWGLGIVTVVWLLLAAPARAQPEACNFDGDCPEYAPLCIGGSCSGDICRRDEDCNANEICFSRVCVGVECRTDEGCSRGRRCVDNECIDCQSNFECGETGLCRSGGCVCTECNDSEDCALDQRCDSATFACVPFCSDDEELVAANDNGKTCRACFKRSTDIRDLTPRACLATGRCQRGFLCAQGYCIPRCNLLSEPPDFDAGRFPELDRMRFLPSGPGSDRGCTRCTTAFELGPVRALLEVAAVSQPVTLRLLDPSGLVLAELGTFSPKKRAPWSTIPGTVSPPLRGQVPADGGCGYQLEIGDTRSKSTVRRSICLVQR